MFLNKKRFTIAIPNLRVLRGTGPVTAGGVAAVVLKDMCGDGCGAGERIYMAIVCTDLKLKRTRWIGVRGVDKD